jgi:hypothetical protein
MVEANFCKTYYEAESSENWFLKIKNEFNEGEEKT